MSKPSKEDRDYIRGYHDAREAKSNSAGSDAFRVITGALLPGVDPVGNSKSYEEGRKDGERDKK